jgi:broad specificity phosphatase PhoE
MSDQIEDRPALWLIRHGQSTWNVLGWRQGQSDDARLTRRGYRQAHRALDSLRRHDIDVVYSSDLRRAHQTASIIADGLGCDVITDERLRERRFGQAEGSRLTELGPDGTGISEGRVVDIDARSNGGESLQDLYLRSSDFLEWIATQQHQGDVVIVAHGGSIRMLKALLTGSEIVDMKWDDVPNGSIHCLTPPTPVTTAMFSTSLREKNGEIK